ncbi:MAG: tetratricopeptide repeat protein [Bacteroidetes bacterium]|nr:MAG: tetratricopeptide repeat protein [Bacteroidota bacterium]
MNAPRVFAAAGLLSLAFVMVSCNRPAADAMTARRGETEPLSNAPNIALPEPRPLKEMPVSTSSAEALTRFQQARRYRHDFIKLSECERLLRQAVALDPDFALAHAYLSLNYSTLGKNAESEASMQRAVALSVHAGEGERMFIAALKEGPTAIASWEQLTRMYPEDKYIHLILGYLYKNTAQNYPMALREFQQVLALDGTLGNAYNMIGYTYMAMEQFDKAEEALRTYAGLFPEAGNPHDSLGDLYLKMGRYAEAVQEFEMACRLEPDMKWSCEKAQENRKKALGNSRD